MGARTAQVMQKSVASAVQTLDDTACSRVNQILVAEELPVRYQLAPLQLKTDPKATLTPCLSAKFVWCISTSITCSHLP